MNKYTENFVIKWHEIDSHKELRPGAFMNMAQELANVHASALKFGYYELIQQEHIWVLSRIKVEFINTPKWGDKVSMSTWHKGQQGLFGLRDFELYDNDNNVAIAATSSWLIINTKTRKIERNNAFNLSEYAQSMALNKNAIEKSADKLLQHNNLELVSSHKVVYSDVDFNHHVNNAKYIDWIMDSIDYEILKQHSIKSFQINYVLEAIMGDTVDIYFAYLNEEKTLLCFEGKKANNISVFIAEIILS